MSDLRTKIEELRAKAADCELLGTLATEQSVRDENRRMARHYRRLIDEAEELLRAHAA
jgi:hypothetical protein